MQEAHCRIEQVLWSHAAESPYLDCDCMCCFSSLRDISGVNSTEAASKHLKIALFVESWGLEVSGAFRNANARVTLPNIVSTTSKTTSKTRFDQRLNSASCHNSSLMHGDAASLLTRFERLH